MTYTAMTDLAHGQLVTETHMDNLRGNIEHLAAMLIGSTALSGMTAGDVISGVREFERGTFTGDGAGSAGSGGQVVALSGSFTPNVIIIFNDDIAVDNNTWTFDGSNLNTAGAGVTAMASGQFTVSDGGADTAPNKNGDDYVYLAMNVAG